MVIVNGSYRSGTTALFNNEVVYEPDHPRLIREILEPRRALSLHGRDPYSFYRKSEFYIDIAKSSPFIGRFGSLPSFNNVATYLSKFNSFNPILQTNQLHHYISGLCKNYSIIHLIRSPISVIESQVRCYNLYTGLPKKIIKNIYPKKFYFRHFQCGGSIEYFLKNSGTDSKILFLIRSFLNEKYTLHDILATNWILSNYAAINSSCHIIRADLLNNDNLSSLFARYGMHLNPEYKPKNVVTGFGQMYGELIERLKIRYMLDVIEEIVGEL